jgi:small GTP-binding protein
MGNWITNLFTFTTEKKLLMIGLDAAGKTTILYKLKLGEVISSIPTIGFNVEQVSYKNLKMNIWDIGGQDKIRKLWKHYYDNCDGLIFVIDSNDAKRLQEAADELGKMHRDIELKNIPFLIFANKQDLPNAVPVHKMDLNLNSMYGRNWKLQGCSALSGDGIYEGLEWLKSQLNK